MLPGLAGFGEKVNGALNERANQLLKEVGLGHRTTHLPGQISGGERQRVAVARSLINQPSVLLADEPTGALDRKNSEHLVNLLKQLNDEKSLTLVMVTHSAESASQMKQAYHLDEGSLRQEKIMNLWKVIRRNLLFFRRHNLGIVLAAAMCSLVLTGALTVGDSVRSTLRNLAEQRIGKGDIAMLSPDGFFEEELATRIHNRLEDEQAVIAP